MSEPVNLSKLIDRMELLVHDLRDHRDDMVVHFHINQFFYLQKIEELKMLQTQIEDLREDMARISARLQASYDLCVSEWRKDARWLNAHSVQKRWKSIL